MGSSPLNGLRGYHYYYSRRCSLITALLTELWLRWTLGFPTHDRRKRVETRLCRVTFASGRVIERSGVGWGGAGAEKEAGRDRAPPNRVSEEWTRLLPRLLLTHRHFVIHLCIRVYPVLHLFSIPDQYPCKPLFPSTISSTAKSQASP